MNTPKPQPTLLVVAPDSDLRQSLEFLLKAEGYTVKTTASWPPSDDFGPADGLIIDEYGLHPKLDLEGLMEGFGNRIIMLVSQLGKMAHIPSATIVRKPLLERTLVDSLKMLIL